MAEGYSEEDTALVHSACIYVATKLGDMHEEVVIVGGVVPSLLADYGDLESEFDAHAGTKDLDLGLALSILEEGWYVELSARLREAGFSPDVNSKGNTTRQRWRLDTNQLLTVDFLISPSSAVDSGGELRDIEKDFAAVITPGLHLAFSDRRKVELSGYTPMGAYAEREMWVCGPGAFLVLKALAFENRGSNKDAYDLFYVLRMIGVEETVRSLKTFHEEPLVDDALSIIRRNFSLHDGLGPTSIAIFITGGLDDDIQADVVGFVKALLETLGYED